MAVVGVKSVQVKSVPVLFCAREQPAKSVAMGAKAGFPSDKLAKAGSPWAMLGRRFLDAHKESPGISLRHAVPFPLTYPFCHSLWSPVDVHALNHAIPCKSPYSLAVTWFLLNNPPHPFQQTILPQIRSFSSPH